MNISSVDAYSKVVTTIDGLFPYISYHVWIAAVNGNGDGEKNETLVMTDSEGKTFPFIRIEVKLWKVININMMLKKQFLYDIAYLDIN